ncbi:MAG: hypothetical protein AAF708_18480 [Deinococcota bacterium]
MLRRSGAVAAGFLLWTVLWLTANALFRVGFPQWYRDDGQALGLMPFVVNLVTATIVSLLAGYLTTRIAKTVHAAFILSALQVIVGLGVAVQFFDVAPLWYHSIFYSSLYLPTFWEATWHEHS